MASKVRRDVRTDTRAGRRRPYAGAVRGARAVLLGLALVVAQVASAAPASSFVAPGDITVTQVDKSSAALSWKPVSEAPGYRVRIAAAGKKTRFVSTPTSSVRITGLSKSTAYSVSAFVVDPASSSPTKALSADSPVWPVTTTKYSRDTPEGLSVTEQRTTSVALAWNPVQGIKPDEKYVVEYSTDFEMEKARKTAGPFPTPAGTLTKLPTNTTFYAKVHVVDAAKKRVSGSSDQITVKTLVPRGAIAGEVDGRTGSDVVATAYAGDEAADTVTVGSDGKYVLRVRPGSYRVQVTPTDPGNFAPVWARSGTSGGRSASEGTLVTVKEKATSTAPTVRVVGGGKVRGAVLDPDKKPVRAVDVTALSDYTPSEREVLAQTQSSNDGAYLLTALPDGQYWLRYRYSGDGFKTRSINVVLKSHVVVAVRVSTSDTWQKTTTADPFTAVNARLDLADFRKRYGASIKGTKKVGSKLTVKAYPWLAGDFPTTRARMTFQWKRDGKPIAKATGSGYRLVKADKGKRITVTATASRYGYRTASVTSKSAKIS